MKRIILAIVVVAFAISGFAQKMPQATLKMKTKEAVQYKPFRTNIKEVGDTIWYNDFSDASEWKVYHTGGDNPDSGNPPGDWEIQNIDDPNAGYYTGTIHSTTWENGYAIYDADKYGDDSNGEDAYIEYVGVIDLSAYRSIAITGQQRYRKWQTTRMFVEVSTDSVNWTQFELNVSTPKSTLDTTPFMINISSAAAEHDTVYIRFHYHGGYDYAWNIDDIAIVEAPEVDLVGEMFNIAFNGGGWYSTIYNNERTFFSRIESYLYNNGIDTVIPSMTITLKKDGDVVFTKTTDSTTTMQPLAPGERDTIFWNTVYDLDGITEEDLFLDTIGNHTFNFELVLNTEGLTDQVMSNNVPIYDFSIDMTDSLMARATTISRLLSINSFGGTQSGDFIGTMYYLPNPDTFESIYIYLASNTDRGEYAGEVQPVVYEWDGSQWNEKLSGDPIDISTLGDGAYFKLSFNSDGFSELFQGGTYYGVGVKQYIDSSQYIGIGCDNVFPHDYPNEVLLQFGGNFYYTSAGVPDVKLYFTPEPASDTTSDTTGAVSTVDMNALKVYPNPATTNIYLENNTGATISIYNLVGEKVMEVADVRRNAVINVEGLKEGTYIVKVVDGNTVKTAKVNIVK